MHQPAFSDTYYFLHEYDALCFHDFNKSQDEQMEKEEEEENKWNPAKLPAKH